MNEQPPKTGSQKYDFSSRKSEDLLYIILNPEEHTPEAVSFAKTEIESRNLSPKDQGEFAEEAAHIREVEIACKNEPLSTRDKIIICIIPPNFVPAILLYFENKGYDRKIAEAKKIPFGERLKYSIIFFATLFVIVICALKLFA